MSRWILLSYRLPREPSRPRLAVWRGLRRLGALQVNDGLAILPLNPETREQFEWLAAAIEDDHGTASLWLSDAATRTQDRQWQESMRMSSAQEYAALIRRAHAARGSTSPARSRRTLRDELRRVRTRDYFGAPGAAEAATAIEALGSQPPVAAR